MALTRAFAIIGTTLWNQLPPSTRSTLLTNEPSASFRSLKTALFSLGVWVSRTGSTSDWCALQEALYKCIDIIQYNPLTQDCYRQLVCSLFHCRRSQAEETACRDSANHKVAQE